MRPYLLAPQPPPRDAALSANRLALRALLKRHGWPYEWLYDVQPCGPGPVLRVYHERRRYSDLELPEGVFAEALTLAQRAALGPQLAPPGQKEARTPSGRR